MSKCHFCESTEKSYKYKNMYPNHPEKDIYICDTCLEKLKTNKETTKKESLELTDELATYIKRWYRNFDYLAQFFDETDICRAVLPRAFTQLNDGTIYDFQLTSELTIPTDYDQTYYSNSPHHEYLKTAYRSVQNHDKHGRAYADHSTKQCAIYRTYHNYQRTIDGRVVLTLLYQKYPELKEFGFSAYAIDYNTELYEIYPNNHIYTPFKALMNGEIGRAHV